jgi:hypothetical protein
MHEKVVEVVEVTQPVVLEQRGVLVAAPLASEVQPRAREQEEEEEESLDQDEEDRLIREGLLTVVENPRLAATPAVAPAAPASATAHRTGNTIFRPWDFHSSLAYLWWFSPILRRLAVYGRYYAY